MQRGIARAMGGQKEELSDIGPDAGTDRKARRRTKRESISIKRGGSQEALNIPRPEMALGSGTI